MALKNANNETNNDKQKKQRHFYTRATILIFDIFSGLFGLSSIAFSSYLIIFKFDYIILFTSPIFQLSTIFLIISGLFVCSISVLGFIGVWKLSKKIIIIYLSLMIIYLLVQSLAGTLALVNYFKLKTSIDNDLTKLIKDQYNQIGYEDKSRVFDKLQEKFKCCGSESYLDYRLSKYVDQLKNNTLSDGNDYNKVSEACCKTPSTQCATSIHPSNINYDGCALHLNEYLNDYLLALSIVDFSSCIFQFIGIILIIILLVKLTNKNDIKNQYRTVSSKEDL